MNELASKLISDHKNPIVKVDLPGSKLFLRSSTPEETAFIEEHQKNLENMFRHDRAERRCARSRGEWSSENELAKVTKVVKTLLHNFGYQDRNGIFLYPEETVFLMETNRLEVTSNKLPLSIQESYDLLSRHKCSLTKYRVYKKLALLGYKVLRYEEILRRELKNQEKNEITCGQKSSRKRNIEECSEIENEVKKMCTQVEVRSSIEDTKVEVVASGSQINEKEFKTSYINDIFEKLRKAAPKECKPEIDNEDPDFCIFLPNNKSRFEYDFNLFICEGSILQRTNYNFSKPAIYAICSDDNISFYRFANVTLPFL